MNQKISLLMVVIALALLNFPAQAQNGSNVPGGNAVRSFPARTGYKYVGPHFVAPGYWGKVGVWTNPTNKQAAKTGYRYVGPHFVAPGYWGKVGAWTNPTNKSNAPKSKPVAR